MAHWDASCSNLTPLRPKGYGKESDDRRNRRRLLRDPGGSLEDL